jgi:hypothetical protein
VIKTGKSLFYGNVDELNSYELKARKNFYDYAIYLKKHREFTKHGL